MFGPKSRCNEIKFVTLFVLTAHQIKCHMKYFLYQKRQISREIIKCNIVFPLPLCVQLIK